VMGGKIMMMVVNRAETLRQKRKFFSF